MEQIDASPSRAILLSIISSHSSRESWEWLRQKLSLIKTEFSEKDFYLTFSLLPRYFGKEQLNFTDEQLREVAQLRKGCFPSDVSAVQVARILLALMIPSKDVQRYLNILNNLFSTGEVNELVALYSALPLLPHSELLKTRASEGIRSNITTVFDAIALNNPFPADYLEDDAFNQMVLKAVFIERPLEKIYGLDSRANKQLARMLSDYAHERWAASRYVTPELWRPVGPFIDEQLLKDIERLLQQGSELEKQAAALAVESSTFAKARDLLPAQLKSGLQNKEFNWKSVSEAWFKAKSVI